MFKLEGHLHMITCLATYQPKGQDTTVIVSGSRDRSLRVWVTQTRSCFQELYVYKCKSELQRALSLYSDNHIQY